MAPRCNAVHGTNRVGFTNQSGVEVQDRISIGDTNRVRFTSEFRLGAQEGISIRDSNRVGLTSKVGLGPKSFGILCCSGSQVQRKQNERPEYPVSQGTPPRTMLLSGPGSRQVHPMGLVG